MPLNQNRIAAFDAERLRVADVVGREPNLKQPSRRRTGEYESQECAALAEREPFCF